MGDDWRMTTDQVITPNIFDVVDEPAAVLPLVLANAMSPRTWALSARAAEGVDMGTQQGQRAALEALRRVIDRSFSHATPARVVQMNGAIDLAAERVRLGDDVMDHAIAVVLEDQRVRRAQGLIRPDDPIVEMIGRGIFPAYSYANVDVVHATRRNRARASKCPKSITSCLDEAALFGALCMTLPTDHLLGITLLASPTHYTVFTWTEGDAAWFYGKNTLLLGDDFRRRTEAEFDGDAHAAFFACMRSIDRIVTRRGHVDLREREGSIPQDELIRIRDALRGFFGADVPSLEVLDHPITITPPSAFDQLFEQCLACDSAEAVQQVVKAHAAGDGPMAHVALQALASYRWLGIRDLSAYVHAARRGPQVQQVARGITTIHDALAVVAGIPGTESVFDDRDRIALPDEVLAFGTGSDRDRALLLHVLLEAVSDQPVVTALLEDDTFVCVGDETVRMSDLARLPLGETAAADAVAASHGGLLVMPSPPQ